MSESQRTHAPTPQAPDSLAFFNWGDMIAIGDVQKRYHDQIELFLNLTRAGEATQEDRELLGMMAAMYQISLVENGQRLAAEHFERQSAALERIAAALGRLA